MRSHISLSTAAAWLPVTALATQMVEPWVRNATITLGPTTTSAPWVKNATSYLQGDPQRGLEGLGFVHMSAAVVGETGIPPEPTSSFSAPMAPMARSAQADLQDGNLNPGYAAFGQTDGMAATTATTTSNNILMSEFVFSGTTYPALTLGGAEEHSSKTALIAPMTTAEPEVTQMAIEEPQQPDAQTTAPAADSSNILISAFTFQGTAYPALPIERGAAQPDSPAANTAAAQDGVGLLPLPPSEEPRPNLGGPQPDTPAAVTTPSAARLPLPATTPFPGPLTAQQAPGISISGTAIPTSLGNGIDLAPALTSSQTLGLLPLPTEPQTLANDQPQPQPQNPYIAADPGFAGITGSAGGAQSFITTARPYAPTTDANGGVGLSPALTGYGGGVWGNGTMAGPGASGTGGWNGTGGGVPYLGAAGRAMGTELGRGWGWGVIWGLWGCWVGVGWI